MSKKLVSADELHTKWMREPKYRKAYDNLEEEFRLASALIEARARAGLTQEELATHEDQARYRAPRERPHKTLDTHPGAYRRGHGAQAQDQL